MLSSSICTCVPSYSPVNKRSFLQALIRINILKHFYPGGIPCHLRPGSRKGWAELWIKHALGLGTVGSEVNSDFLFTRRDLRPLWLPAAFCCVCALVSGFVCTELQMASLTASRYLAFREKRNILPSLIVGSLLVL